MKIAVVTLFPEIFSDFCRTGVVGRAINSGIIEVEFYNIRDFAIDDYGTVDDYQYGGGAGMLMRPEPLFKAFDSISWKDNARVILLTPQGKRIDQLMIRELASERKFVLFCGRYGGIDERFRRTVITDEVSVGDFVVSGGEIPAMLLMDAVFRWVPGVLGRFESAETDSFSTGLLDFPRYTRPADYREMQVPEILLSGNHMEIENWRFKKALDLTRKQRPDLLEGIDLTRLEENFRKVLRRADRVREQKDG